MFWAKSNVKSMKLSCIVRICQVWLWWAQPHINKPQTKPGERAKRWAQPILLLPIESRQPHNNHTSKCISEYEAKVSRYTGVNFSCGRSGEMTRCVVLIGWALAIQILGRKVKAWPSVRSVADHTTTTAGNIYAGIKRRSGNIYNRFEHA
jgi:hypothetical protein